MLLADGLRTVLADAIDASLTTDGSARFQNAAQTITYATCNLSNPAFGSAATGVITLSGTPTETSASAGTTLACGFYDAVTGGALQFSLGVNDTGTPDMTISNNVLQASDQVEISSLTITVPAGSKVTS